MQRNVANFGPPSLNLILAQEDSDCLGWRRF